MADEPTPDPSPSPAPAPAPAPTPGPAEVPDWRGAIPPEYAAEKVWEPYAGKGLDVVLKAHAEQSKLIGRSITLPGKDAKPEDVARWKETQVPRLVEAGLITAAPPAPDKYDLKPHAIAHIPPFNEDRLAFYKGKFHGLGLTNAQAQGLLEAHAEDLATLVKTADQTNLAAIEGLAGQWGQALFDRRWAMAQRAVDPLAQRIGMEPATLRAYLDSTRKGNDPILFQLLCSVGEAIDEDTGIGVEVAGVGGPDQARQEIERLRASDAFKQEQHPQHAAILKRVEDLYKLAYGTARGETMARPS